MATNYAIDLNWIHHRLILWIDPRCWMVCLLFFAAGKSRNNDNLSIDWKCIRECQRASAYRPVWRMYAQKKKKKLSHALCLPSNDSDFASTHFNACLFFVTSTTSLVVDCDLTDFWNALYVHRVRAHSYYVIIFNAIKTKVRETTESTFLLNSNGRSITI